MSGVFTFASWSNYRQQKERERERERENNDKKKKKRREEKKENVLVCQTRISLSHCYIQLLSRYSLVSTRRQYLLLFIKIDNHRLLHLL